MRYYSAFLLLICIWSYGQDNTVINPVSQDHKTSNAYFSGGQSALKNFIAENIVYPNEALEQEIEDNFFLIFTIDKQGNTEDIQCTDSSVSEILVNEAIRVVRLSDGQWIPAYNEGRPINSTFSLPFGFMLDKTSDEAELIEAERKNKLLPVSASSKIYEYYEVAKIASLPNQKNGIKSYLEYNLKYPQDCKEKGLEAAVLVTFIVDGKGQVQDVEVLTLDVLKAFTNEVIQVLESSSGLWIPAERDGERVSMRMTLPIKFELER